MRIILIVLLQVIFLSAFGQEQASIIKQDVVYTINTNQTAEVEETYTLKIVSEKGNSYAVYQEFLDKFRKLTEISIDVYNKQGAKVKRMRRIDGHEFGFNPSYEINDGKVFVLDPDFRDYPYTIEVKSKIKINGFTSLPAWVPRSYFNFSVIEANLTVIHPQNLLIKFNEENITGQETKSDGMVRRLYSVKSLPAVEKKIRYKDFYKEQPKVFVCPQHFQLDDVEGSNQSWKEFGDWFLKLNSDPYTLTAETKSFIDSIDKSDQAVLIKKVYEYMQDKTRYVSIQLGIGGFKSLPTNEVEKYGYGDCKALSTYAKNMLDYAGIKSNYILVRAGEDVPEIMNNFPSNQFNHVYIGIPSPRDTIYLECTSQISPVNHTGTFTDDRYVLWIEKNESSLIRSRVHSHLNNIKTSKINVALNKEGNTIIQYSIDNQGIFFDEVMLYKMAPEGYVKRHNEEKFVFDNFTVKNFTYNQPSRNVPFFSTQFKVEVDNLAKLVNEKLILPTHVLSPVNDYIETDELMKYFSIPRGITLFDEVVVSIPENFWIGNLPQPEKVTSSYGSFETNMEASADKLIIRKKLVLFKGDYTKEKYADFRKFYDQVEKIERRRIILNSKT